MDVHVDDTCHKVYDIEVAEFNINIYIRLTSVFSINNSEYHHDNFDVPLKCNSI